MKLDDRPDDKAIRKKWVLYQDDDIFLQYPHAYILVRVAKADVDNYKNRSIIGNTTSR